MKTTSNEFSEEVGVAQRYKPLSTRREFVLQGVALLGSGYLSRSENSDATEGDASVTAPFEGAARVRVEGLKVDYTDRPLGLENCWPRLSWRLVSKERNVQQSAYRILVASSESALRAGRYDLWDSGKVESRKSFGIVYRGSPLVSRQRCWWAAQVWDEKKVPSELSQVSWWEMGLLSPKEWSAQ